MGLLKRYNRNLIKRGFNGPLAFHQKYVLGQIITFDRRSGFEVIGDISDPYFGIDFVPKKHIGESEADIDFSSEKGVNIQTKIKGNAKIPNSNLNVNDAGFVIDFGQTASYILKTAKTKVQYIENVAELGSIVKDLYLRSKWNRKWFIMTQLIEAENVTLLIAKSNTAKIELKADGAFTGGEEDLVNAEVNFSLVMKKDMGTNVIGRSGPYYPLFKANGIEVKRRSIVGSPFNSLNRVNPMNTFTIAKIKENDPEFELAFEESDFSEELYLDDEYPLT